MHDNIGGKMKKVLLVLLVFLAAVLSISAASDKFGKGGAGVVHGVPHVEIDSLGVSYLWGDSARMDSVIYVDSLQSISAAGVKIEGTTFDEDTVFTTRVRANYLQATDSLKLTKTLRMDAAGVLYYYDTGVSKWLSVAHEVLIYSRGQYNTAGGYIYLRCGDNVQCHNAELGYPAERDLQIVGVAFADDTVYAATVGSPTNGIADSVLLRVWASGVTDAALYDFYLKNQDQFWDAAADSAVAGALYAQTGDIIRAWLDPIGGGDGKQKSNSPIVKIVLRYIGSF
jgi:hypothetical protein